MKLETVEKTAREVMEKYGKHLPNLLVEDEKKKQLYYMALVFKDGEEKESMLKNIRKLIIKLRVDKYYVIMESWVGSSLFVQPSKDENRKQALIISEYNRNQKNQTIISEFENENGKIEWIDRKVMSQDTETYSRWNFFLEDASQERIDKARIEASLKILEDNISSQNLKEFMEKTNCPIDDIEMVKDLMRDMVKRGKVYFDEINKTIIFNR